MRKHPAFFEAHLHDFQFPAINLANCKAAFRPWCFMGKSRTPLLFQARHASRAPALDCLLAYMFEDGQGLGKPKMQTGDASDVKTPNPFCNAHSMNLSRTFRPMDLRCQTSSRLHHGFLSIKKYVGYF
jgi:hypothetical protein